MVAMTALVSRMVTCGQTLDSQFEQLRKAGCNGRNIYREKATGSPSSRGAVGYAALTHPTLIPDV
jgi:hypothetical protein